MHLISVNLKLCCDAQAKLSYSPILTSEGSKDRRFHGVARGIEIRIIPLIAYPLHVDKAHWQVINVTI